MSEEKNERDFMKACFNAVAGLEVKNESQAIAKEVILDEVENLTKENKQLKDVIEEVREYTKSHFKEMVADEEAQGLLQILDKAMDN